jgi:hypothetical protein
MTTERELQTPVLDAVEEWHLGWLPRKEIADGYTYLGTGGLIGSIAIATVEDGQIKFKGCPSFQTNPSLKIETPEPSEIKRVTFWPTKRLTPAPDLSEKYLIRWILNQERALFLRQIHNLEALPPELKDLEAYSEYLEFFTAALQNTVRRISLAESHQRSVSIN